MTGEDREQGREERREQRWDRLRRELLLKIQRALPEGWGNQAMMDLKAFEDAVRADALGSSRITFNDWRNFQSGLDLALRRASRAEERAEAAEAGKREAEEDCARAENLMASGQDLLLEKLKRIEALEAEGDQLKAELKEERSNWTFVPDENGGHLLSRYKDKWVPYGMLSDARSYIERLRAEIERLRAQLTKEQEHWRLIVSSVESKEAEIERLRGERDEAPQGRWTHEALARFLRNRARTWRQRAQSLAPVREADELHIEARAFEEMAAALPADPKVRAALQDTEPQPEPKNE